MPSTVANSSSPQVATTTTYTRVMQMPIRNTTRAAKNLPRTMPLRRTGAVSRS